MRDNWSRETAGGVLALWLVSDALLLTGLLDSCISGLLDGHISEDKGFFSLSLAVTAVWTIAFQPPAESFTQ